MMKNIRRATTTTTITTTITTNINMTMMCAVVCVGLLCGLNAGDTFAQTRRRGAGAASRATRRSGSSNSAKPVAANRAGLVTEARTEVANQINNLTRFLYVYGRVAKDLDDTTAEARATANEAQRRGVQAANATQAVERNKAQVQQNFANIRAGLNALDEKFAAATELARFRLELSTARTAAQEAAQLVGQERFDAAGRRLIDAAAALTSILQQMR